MAFKNLTLQVQGERTIHCGGCESTIQHTLSQLAGVEQVKASRQTQQIKLTLDEDAASVGKVTQELDEIGYRVVEV